MSPEGADHYLWIMLGKPLLVVASIPMNPEGAGPARETSTSSNQYFFPLDPEFSIAWRVGSGTRILTRLEIDTEPGHEIGIEYSGRVTTLVSSTRAGQKVGMKTRPGGQSRKIRDRLKTYDQHSSSKMSAMRQTLLIHSVIRIDLRHFLKNQSWSYQN